MLNLLGIYSDNNSNNASSSVNQLKVHEIVVTSPDNVPTGKVSLQYLNEELPEDRYISNLVFNTDFSKYLNEFKEVAVSNSFVVKITNLTKETTLLGTVTNIANTEVKITIATDDEKSFTTQEIEVDDELIVELDFASEDHEEEIIKVRDKSQIVNQDLDNTKIYKLMTSISLTASERIRTNNLKKLIGLGHNDTTISSPETNGVIFETTGDGGGNVDIENIQLSASGTNAKVFNLTDETGNNEIRLLSVNFSNCKSLGDLHGFRQLYWEDIGVYGCQDGVTLHGAFNGARVGNLNLFGFSSTGTLFKQGTDLEFSNRFFASLNFDVPTGAKLLDFQEDVFNAPELLQINSSIAKVNGEIKEENTTALIPNVSANNIKALFSANIGLYNSATERYVEDLEVSNTFNINWLKNTFYLNMIGNTTFTESDLPASGKNSEEIKIYLTGNFIPTFPAAWYTNLVGTYKGDEINEITIKYVKSNVYFVNISNSLVVYPAPDLNSTNPVSLLPSQTQELNLYGSFFTPQTIVSIEGQTVNSVEFVNSGHLILSVTTGATEGEFDITISNGTSVTFENALIINLGDVFVPNSVDYININQPIDIDTQGTIRLASNGSTGSAELNKQFDTSKDFRISFELTKSALNSNPLDQSAGNDLLSLYDISGSLLFRVWNYNSRNIEIYDSTNSLLNRYAINGNIYGQKFDVDYIAGIWYFYTDRILKHTSSIHNNLSENVKSIWSVKRNDITNIKYIELP